MACWALRYNRHSVFFLQKVYHLQQLEMTNIFSCSHRLCSLLIQRNCDISDNAHIGFLSKDN